MVTMYNENPDWLAENWPEKRLKKKNRLERLLNKTFTYKSQGAGPIELVGNFWNMANSREKLAAKEGVESARKMAMAGVLAVKAGSRVGGPQEQKRLVRLWFGNNVENQILATLVIRVIEAYLIGNVKLYFRGKPQLINRVTDAPVIEGNGIRIDADDVECFAYAMPVARDRTIFLSEEYFKLASTRGGFDALGGVIIHELTHNLCNTDDYEYSRNSALNLAIQNNHRAVMNADNYEYFCEALFPELTSSYNATDKQNAKVHSAKARKKLESLLDEEGDIFGNLFD